MRRRRDLRGLQPGQVPRLLLGPERPLPGRLPLPPGQSAAPDRRCRPTTTRAQQPHGQRRQPEGAADQLCVRKTPRRRPLCPVPPPPPPPLSLSRAGDCVPPLIHGGPGQSRLFCILARGSVARGLCFSVSLARSLALARQTTARTAAASGRSTPGSPQSTTRAATRTTATTFATPASRRPATSSAR
eukprot:SAG22_NODE_233_length_14378_cov_86.382100_5_plen_187_part_00